VSDERVLAPFGRRSARVFERQVHGSYVVLRCSDPDGPRPRAGQFYMLAAAERWGGGEDQRPFLPRAFSVLRAPQGTSELQFLIEDVGPGTNRLCELEAGDDLLIVGPLGVGFTAPPAGSRALLVGGGVGIAPLAILQDELGGAAPALLWFRDAARAEGARLLAGAEVATDDGSVGHNGLVTELLEDELDGHEVVYSCGPPPMLDAVRAICAARGVPAQLALESGMACGFGACFGCVVATKDGLIRLCLEGPVLAAERLEAGDRSASPRSRPHISASRYQGDRSDVRPSHRVDFCGLELEHPVINASGTFDAIAARRVFGERLIERFPFAAFVSKTVTLEPRQGNPPPRLWELAAGMINSIGLPNRGLRGYLAHDLPELARLPVPLIVNVMGFTRDEVAELVQAFAPRPEVAALELNVSCPNVETGLMMGAEPNEVAALLQRVRPLTDKPLIVKLTPNATDVAAVARAAQDAGASAVSLINTIRGMALDPATGRPWLGGVTGGVSGPAVRSIAVAQVHAVANAVQVPIVGMGGVQSARDARDLLRAGATLVAVGTESFRDPAAGARIAAELDGLLAKSANNRRTARR
jgi:dihydroorotate dehydrogenase subfamily 1